MDLHTLSDEAFGALAAGRPAPATVAELRRAQLGRHLLMLRELHKINPLPRYAVSPAGLSDPLQSAWTAARLRSLAAAGTTAAPDGPDAGRVLRASHGGLELSVRLADTDPRGGLLGLAPTGRLTGEQVAGWQRALDDAWRILVTRHRPAAVTLAAVLDVLVPVEPDPAARGISASSADAFGAVAMSAPDSAAALAAGLLHETQHSLLNAVQFLFDLHHDPAALGYSPWRDDPRPASGILHGAYAYLAVVRFWRTERAALTGPAARIADFEFARWRAAVATTAATLLAGGPTSAGRPEAAGVGLTAAGRRFVGALLDEVRPWLVEPVDPGVVRLAESANADHRLGWRLRNLRVDPADAAALAAAWRAGEPPPAGSLRAAIVPAPRRALENNPRLHLAHELLTREPATPEPDARAEPAEQAEPEPDTQAEPRGSERRRAGAGATAGDGAYLAGDGGSALCSYRERVLRDGGDRSAWAGLALAGGLADRRVELAVAAHLVLAGPERRAGRPGPDPVELLGWIP